MITYRIIVELKHDQQCLLEIFPNLKQMLFDKFQRFQQVCIRAIYPSIYASFLLQIYNYEGCSIRIVLARGSRAECCPRG